MYRCIKKENLKIEIIRLKPYCPETCKSSLINKKGLRVNDCAHKQLTYGSDIDSDF